MAEAGQLMLRVENVEVEEDSVISVEDVVGDYVLERVIVFEADETRIDTDKIFVARSESVCHGADLMDLTEWLFGVAQPLAAFKLNDSVYVIALALSNSELEVLKFDRIKQLNVRCGWPCCCDDVLEDVRDAAEIYIHDEKYKNKLMAFDEVELGYALRINDLDPDTYFIATKKSDDEHVYIVQLVEEPRRVIVKVFEKIKDP